MKWKEDGIIPYYYILANNDKILQKLLNKYFIEMGISYSLNGVVFLIAQKRKNIRLVKLPNKLPAQCTNYLRKNINTSITVFENMCIYMSV